MLVPKLSIEFQLDNMEPTEYDLTLTAMQYIADCAADRITTMAISEAIGSGTLPAWIEGRREELSNLCGHLCHLIKRGSVEINAGF